MPRPRRPEYDSAEFAKRYHGGETLSSLAEWLGVSLVAVFRAAQRRGFSRYHIPRLRAERKAAQEAHARAIKRGDTRVQHYTGERLRRATHALMAAESGR